MNHPAIIKFTCNETTLAEVPEIQSDQPLIRVNRLEKQFISTSAGMGMLGGGGSAVEIIVNHQDYERNQSNYYQMKIIQSEVNRMEIYIFKGATLKQLKVSFSVLRIQQINMVSRMRLLEKLSFFPNRMEQHGNIFLLKISDWSIKDEN